MTAAQHEQEQLTSLEANVEKAVDVDQLIRDLDAAMGRFPEATLRDCQKHRDLVISRLIEVLQETARLGHEGIIRDGNATLFALFLLAEFRATQAIDAVVEFLRIPGEIVDSLLGDAITEDLPRILATFATDRPEILELLIFDSQANEYVRSGALGAQKYLVRDGLVLRSELVQRLRDYLPKLVEEEAVWPATLVVSMLADLRVAEARPEIERAYEAGVIEEGFIDLEYVDQLLVRETAAFDSDLTNLAPTFKTDTVEEMRHWNWSDDESRLDEESDSDDDFEFDEDWLLNQVASRIRNSLINESDISMIDDDIDNVAPHRTDTIRHDAPHVGRNDPCPCGSGKKYKKCCLRKANTQMIEND